MSVMLGNGNGSCHSAAQTFAAAAGPYALALGDVNGDGKPDLVITNSFPYSASSGVGVLLGNGNGTFQAQQTFGGGSQPTFLALVDVNGDGKPDLIFANRVSDDISVLLASGNGDFTDQVYTIPADHFTFAGLPLNSAAGNAFIMVVTAQNLGNNIDANFSGTIHFSSTDPQAQLPPDTTLTGGVGVFATTLKTTGTQTFSATEQGNTAVIGTSNSIVVTAVAASHFAIAAPANAVAGVATTVTVTAIDPYGNTAPSYAGAIHFSSSDTAATLPPESTLSSGIGAFSATFATAGNQTLTATDPVSGMTGVNAAIAVRGLIVTGLLPTPNGFAVTFDKPFDPTTLSLYYAPDDILLVNAAGHLVRGSLILNTASGVPPNTSFTFIAASGMLTAGTYTVTLVSGPSGIKDSTGVQLDGTDSGIPGDNYVANFTVASTPSVILSIPDFARGPNSAANILLPNKTGGGIPITLTGAANLTDLTFTLTYNPALLTISGTLNGPSGSFTLQSNSGGVASFSFQSATPLNGTLTLGSLIAQVPNSAASSYKSKAMLELTNIVINGGTTTVTADDAVEAVAYFGDVAGTGSFSPLDAALMGQVAANFTSGFAAFAQLDPAIIGDVSGLGNVDSADVTLMNRLIAGIAVPQIPQPPSGLIIPPTGPDPTLSLPADLMVTPGGTVTVPVNIDTARPEGSSGMMEATLALRYDPQAFSLTAADIKLGTVPNAGSGWQLGAAINPDTGEIGITLFSTTPIQSTAGGSLVTITLQVNGGAALGQAAITLVDDVNPTGFRSYQTGLADSQGALVVHVATSGDEPAMSGVRIGVGDAVRTVDGAMTKAEMVTDLQTGARHTSLAPFWTNSDQISADADGTVSGQNELLPQIGPAYLIADDWGQLFSDAEVDPTTGQADDLSVLLASLDKVL